MISPEIVHNGMTRFGEQLGKHALLRNAISRILVVPHEPLKQVVAGIEFQNPIGLAAGFDYEGRLPDILPAIGFGFHTIGTITNHPYAGNPRPMLGRLPQSKSLMVNKGFKNMGASAMTRKLSHRAFPIPLGISIGKTNVLSLKTQKQAINDIIQGFLIVEKARINNSYYELNISCPNLYGPVNFYSVVNLHELLSAVDGLDLKKPLFVKMPIDKTDHDTLVMLEVIANHSPAGIIIGNLQKNRKDPAFVQCEVNQFKMGNFSGKPTFERSNQLIQLAYRHYQRRLAIIGCGGVFNGADAYQKITLGASLVQLITGMIFQGPQVIAQIHEELVDLLHNDGLDSISQAVGIHNASVRLVM